MTAPDSITEMQLQHLLERVHQRRDEQCESLLQQARELAGQLLDDAYRDARQRLHREIYAAAERSEKRLAAAQAEQATRLRQQRQRDEQCLLEQLWEPLRESLHKRWHQIQTRQHWVDSVLLRADNALIERHWQVLCPDDFPTDERQRLSEFLRYRGIEASVESSREIHAGLRVITPQAEVDGTVKGLLRQRHKVEARVLAVMRQSQMRGITP